MLSGKSMWSWFLGAVVSGLSCLHAQLITVNPVEYPNALANPMMGFRPGFAGKKTPAWNANPYTTIYRHYIYWKDIENDESDTVQKIRDYCNVAWAGCEAANVKIIPRVILQYGDTEYYFPSDIPNGDYSSPQIKNRVARLIARLGEVWDNDPRVAWVQTGIIGKWGEQENPVNVNQNGWIKIMGDAFAAAFPNKIQLVRNQNYWTAEGYKEMGVYWDSFAHIDQYSGSWTWVKDSNAAGRYLIAPIEGEIAYDWGSGPSHYGSTPTATVSTPAFYNYVIDTIRQLHGSGLGWVSDYTQNASTALGASQMQKAFGYRLLISEFKCSANTAPGNTLTVSAKIKNAGSAPMYENWPVAFVLINELTRQIVYQSEISGIDIRNWMPGHNYDWDPISNPNGSRIYLTPAADNLINASIAIPPALAAGQYLAGITILEPTTRTPGIFFAVTNFFKESQTQPLARIGIGMDASNNTLNTTIFDDPVANDTRYYVLTASTNFSLTTNATAGGSISPGSGSYAPGTLVTVTATANTGFVFSSWSGDLSGGPSGASTATATITINAAKRVTANFTAASTPTTPPQPTTGKSTGGGGSISGWFAVLLGLIVFARLIRSHRQRRMFPCRDLT